MKMVLKERIFLLDKRKGILEWITEQIYLLKKELSINPEIETSQEVGVRVLPAEYDFYFVHTSNLFTFDAVKVLRKQNRKSYILGYTTMSDSAYNAKELGFDDICFIQDLNRDEIKHVLQKSY